MDSKWLPDKISIINLNGSVVKKYDIKNIENTTLNISDLPTGMYYFVLDDTKYYKIVKY